MMPRKEKEKVLQVNLTKLAVLLSGDLWMNFFFVLLCFTFQIV